MMRFLRKFTSNQITQKAPKLKNQAIEVNKQIFCMTLSENGLLQILEKADSFTQQNF